MKKISLTFIALVFCILNTMATDYIWNDTSGAHDFPNETISGTNTYTFVSRNGTEFCIGGDLNTSVNVYLDGQKVGTYTDWYGYIDGNAPFGYHVTFTDAGSHTISVSGGATILHASVKHPVEYQVRVRTITLDEPGDLQYHISDTEKYYITKLTISGPINGDDMRIIHEMAGCSVSGTYTSGVLSVLDMRNAVMTSGGGMCGFYHDTYYGTYGDYDDVYHAYMGNNVINTGLFCGCTSLTSIVIPKTVTEIRKFAFLGCNNLTSITFPASASVTSIGEAAFAGCNALSKPIAEDLAAWCAIDFYQEGSNPMYYAKTLYTTSDYAPTNITIPTGCKKIGKYAFYNNQNLTSITFPEGIESIGIGAFKRCTNLTSIIANGGLGVVQGSAFSECTKISSVNTNNIAEWCKSSFTIRTEEYNVMDSQGNVAYGWDDEDGNYYIRALRVTGSSNPTTFSKNLKVNGILVSNVSIPEGTYKIGSAAFYNCSNIKSISIPSSIRSIGKMAFEGCSNLTTCNITDISSWNDIQFETYCLSQANCTLYVDEVIGGQTYYDATYSDKYYYSSNPSLLSGNLYCNGKLITRAIFDNSTTIINTPFEYCKNQIESVLIPSSVTSINNSAFNGCSNLSIVKVDKDTPLSIVSTTFSNRAKATLYVPSGSRSSYVAANYWTDFKEIVEWDDYSPAIDFADTNVKAICVANWDTNGDGELSEAEAAIVTSLGTVFRNNSSITSFNELQYFTRITNIASHAFENCTNLISISIPANVVNIYEFAFYGCSSLKELILIDGEKTLYIKENYEDEEYEDVEDGGTYTIRCYYPAFDCSLNNVYIGRNISGEYSGQSQYLASGGVFRRLKNVTISNSVTSIDYRLFANTSLTSIAIPNSVKSIGPEAFRFCPLTSINIPNNVISIGDYAFLSCDFLTIVKLDIETPLSIVANTFSNRRNATLYVPAGSEEAYRNAPYWQEFGSIIGFINGDVNGDEEVDVVDVVDIVRYAIDDPSEAFVPILADINSSGEVNVGDAVSLVNIIAGDQNFAKAMRAPQQNSIPDDALTLTSTNNGLSLCLENGRSYTAFQFDLFVPEGTDVAQMLLNAQRKQKHQLLYNKVEEGHYRVAAISTSNHTFQGNDGELLSIALNSDSDGEIAIRNIHFFDTEGGDYMFNEILFEGTTTGIAVTPSTTPMDGAFYTIDGRRIGEKPTTKGLYIVNGKKVVIK